MLPEELQLRVSDAMKRRSNDEAKCPSLRSIACLDEFSQRFDLLKVQ